MNIDAFSIIGDYHKGSFCQDFYRVGYKYIMISDGCSSAPDTDIGSRILLTAAESLQYDGTLPSLISVMNYAKGVVNLLGLDESCLEATLLLAYVKEQSLHYSVVGDGFIFYKEKEKDPTFIELSYKENAPYYPTIATSKEKALEWKRAFMGNDLIVSTNSGSVSLHPQIYSGIMPIGSLEYFGLSSDGLGSFTRSNDKEYSISEIFSRIFDFKGFQGSFVKRKMLRVIKDLSELGVKNFDDISVAMMYSFEDK